jgi:hypothetical protein
MVASVDAAASSRPYPSVPPGFVIRAALALRNFVLRIAHAMAPPEVRLFELGTGVMVGRGLGIIAKLGFADLLARRGPMTAAEIAAELGTNADATHRALRGMAFLGIFRLRPDGRFENNRYSLAMRSGTRSRLREGLLYYSSKSNLDAWDQFETTLRTGRNAFVHAHGMSVWEWFDRHPDERENFAQFMMGLTTADAPVVASLYPWREVKRVCDAGGGRGTLLSEILIRHPHLSGVLCDAPGVIASARTLLAQRGVLDRVQLVAGSFFEEVPAGADAYILKNILHDWDDGRSLKILSVLRRAMQPGARVVLVETITERNDTSSLGVLADLHMMTVCDEGRERSRSELEALLSASGFRPGRVFPFPTVSVVEGIAV